jgi:4-amino-4-deoxy-L-arabinose transferase-like glycosyltransferase
MPIVCALSVVLVRPNPSIPIVDLAAYQRPMDAARPWLARGSTAANDRLVAFLQSQRQGERFTIAVPSSMLAAPLIIATGMPVIAMGGFSGADPILTPTRLQQLVDGHQLRFVMIGGLRSRQRNTSLDAIGDWVRSHGRPVDPALWRRSPQAGDERADAGGPRRTPAELFDVHG